ncbi:uncharacterized protein LOC5502009 isoform X5 [Nematostella vectensis]|uniref:uncharacterized protein LOC5502009 isoform X5 n=1 Tax=Nematostella vectensis TaxID=45351 RepID=UPI00207773E9|nr:uncharacterized protein LOC5502009 isoform X5 [Nematostella vectensis]
MTGAMKVRVIIISFTAVFTLIYLALNNSSLGRKTMSFFSGSKLNNGSKLDNGSKLNNGSKDDEDSKLDDGLRVHIVTQYTLHNNSKKLEIIEKRQKEMLEALQINLDHPHVAKVHVLCKDNSEMQYVVHSKLNNSDKLLFQHIGHDLCFSDVFRYIGENLLGETAMQLNIDCFLEQGWHQLNNTLLQDKTMYALTRHETDYSIKHCNGIEFCPNDRTATQGSHDAFIVNLISPLPEAMLKQMEILKLPYGGIEQALISLFRKYGFKVKNPCRILRIFHHHCSQYRDMEQKYIKGQRIDHFLGIGGSSGLVYNTGL